MKPPFTPAQQNLVDFLNKLASSPYSPQLMEEGNQALDAAVEETQQLQDNIHRVCNAMRSAQQTAKLDGVIN